MKLFIWPRWYLKSPIMFSIAETEEQARQLIVDKCAQLKQAMSESDYYDPDDLVGLGITNSPEPEVFDVDTPDGFIL